MKRKRYSTGQIVAAIKQHEPGTPSSGHSLFVNPRHPGRTIRTRMISRCPARVEYPASCRETQNECHRERSRVRSGDPPPRLPSFAIWPTLAVRWLV